MPQDDTEWLEALSGTGSINMAKIHGDVARLNEQVWDEVRDWKLLAPNPKVSSSLHRRQTQTHTHIQTHHVHPISILNCWPRR